ncbi:uncharacterized protein EDB91DRAFT_393993 [Suillus paluster]|uniref:uncharacterized protein n=1 Tax=Suillus paluster TaxID=48578 RepID=UPI001B85F30C|nr:uncharacterized protein EDB91DRAFT_393993 [Suillus paluster]KAG1739138.1 hypothetical protein EDB91DRAFT_393993 [Suillus paluster]
MSFHRSNRALRVTSPKMNAVPLPQGAHTPKNPIPAPYLGKLDMDEATLRKLSRAQLQKLAKENKVKANMKSEVIIKELVKLCKVVLLHQDEESEEPPRKKSRKSEENPPIAGPSTRIIDVPMDTSLEQLPTQEDSLKSALTTENTAPIIAAGNAADIAAEGPTGKSRGPSPVLESHAGHPAAEDATSDSGSDLSYANPGQQNYYKSPVSSRAGTPPLEEPMMLKRAVNIMDQITADDQRIIAQIATLRERAAMLKEQAKKVRDVVRAEQGRRVRLEAYFTYWREISPKWPKDWIYKEGEEEQIRTEQMLRTMTPPYALRRPSLTCISDHFFYRLPSIGPSGPPTLPFDKRDAP